MTCTPGHRIARHHRALDGRRAPPARQQRAMQVERPQPGRVQHRGRQDLAERHHYGSVEVQRLEGRDLALVAHRGRRADRQALFQGERMHRRGLQCLAAAPRRRRLGIDAGDLVASLDKTGERGEREVGSSQEGKTHGRGLAARNYRASFTVDRADSEGASLCALF
jgi:hypothetical protein